MDSTVELWFLKGSPKENVREHLMGYKKARLFQLGELHQVAVKKNDTKPRIIDALAPIIKQHFTENLTNFTRLEKEQLAQIKAHQTDEVELSQVKDLVEKGYLFVYLDKGQIDVVLPKDLQMEDAKEQASSSDFAVFLRNATTFEQIFGHVNIDYLVTVWNRYYDHQLDIEEASELLQEHKMSR